MPDVRSSAFSGFGEAAVEAFVIGSGHAATGLLVESGSGAEKSDGSLDASLCKSELSEVG
jgi:hypothetical protein